MRFALASIILFSASICIAQPIRAPEKQTPEKLTIERTDHSKVAAQIYRGEKGRPTFVLLNGLIYETNRWSPVAKRLIERGFTVVQYAYSAQPESLRTYKGPPPFLRRGFDLKTLATELGDVLDAFEIRERVNIVGLSYGASVAAEYIATHPSRVEASILIAPLVVPLENYNPAGRSLRSWLGVVRFWEDAPCAIYGGLNPFLCMANDAWYDSFYEYYYGSLLKQSLKTAPPGVELATYKRSVFHLVRAAREFNLRHYVSKLPNVHFLIAEKDERQLLNDQLATWNDVPKVQRGSLTLFAKAQHTLPDEAPEHVADVLTAIATKDSRFQNDARLRIED